MANQWQIGDRIENRWVISKILRGGMGLVYVVYDSQFDQVCAAKTFKDEFLPLPRVREQFVQEAHTWINLDLHQHVVRAYFVEIIHGRPFIFLEYLPGGDLEGRIRKQLPKLRDVLRWGIQFCYGMEHALSKGVRAHRDIKPSNCLLSEDGLLKIADFGLAKVFKSPAEEGGKGGTWEYMPPEQWSKFEAADERTDIYSFGVMLFQMATGRMPFGRRDTVSVSELERRHKEMTAPMLNGVAACLNPVVHTCLRKQPEARYQAFGEVRKDLAELLAQISGETVSPPPTGVELEARELCDKGAALNNLQRYDEAIRVLDEALRRNPQSSMVWNNKAYALRHKGRLGEALSAFDMALTLGSNFHALLNKAELLYSTNRWVEALKYQEEAIALNPDSSLAWNNKGRTHFALEQYDLAVDCYKKAIELDSRNTLTLGNIGLCCQKQGNHLEAISWFDKALEIDPLYAEVLNGKALSLVHCERHAEAVACLRKAIQVDPGNAVLWDNLGRLFYEAGEFERALEAFNETLKLDPNRKLARLLRANCRMQLNR